jgi:VanZ family protein
MVYWIFSNSMQEGAVSSERSENVTEIVQEVVGTIAPSSPIATATGSDFDRLHNFVRKSAHFLEYALLGALLLWSCLSYTRLKRFLFAPPCVAFLVATFDECIQSYVSDRMSSITDVCIDSFGALAGMIFALLCVWIAWAIVRSVRKKRRARAAKG